MLVTSYLSGCAEGKKWFDQPCLSVQEGQVTDPPVVFVTIPIRHVCLLAVWHLRVKTATILTLQKVLNPNLAAHQASVDQVEAAEHPAPSSNQHAAGAGAFSQC